MRKRQIKKTIRFTEEEIEKLERVAKGKGITLSELIRKKALDVELPQRISPERLAKRNQVFRQLAYEINRIGVNLNQIARYCNRNREIDCLVLQEILETKRLLETLLETAYNELTSDNKPATGT